ncbi:MAG: hypothetical protein LC114_14585 [Bryobacterales bacterium]|nr:hypothetical protein [Bryobacterales bacterium]
MSRCGTSATAGRWERSSSSIERKPKPQNDLEWAGVTGKEREAETGLDYFGARYLSGVPRWWTSPDPVIVTPARMEDPQRFNLYAYARNNPFRFIDPRGEDIKFANDTEEGRKKVLALITRNLSAREAANIGIRQTKNGAFKAYVIDKGTVGKDAMGGRGPISSWRQSDSVFGPNPGSKHVNVLVTQGNPPAALRSGAAEGKPSIKAFNPTS